ncbi:hypothetical protein Btru_030449 [Bulinus truncatus]|nr:hypothetical protein Btru_030449 [Bulinus truncatus]
MSVYGTTFTQRCQRAFTTFIRGHQRAGYTLIQSRLLENPIATVIQHQEPGKDELSQGGKDHIFWYWNEAADLGSATNGSCSTAQHPLTSTSFVFILRCELSHFDMDESVISRNCLQYCGMLYESS